jgi:hypothetical protein
MTLESNQAIDVTIVIIVLTFDINFQNTPVGERPRHPWYFTRLIWELQFPWGFCPKPRVASPRDEKPAPLALAFGSPPRREAAPRFQLESMGRYSKSPEARQQTL